MNIKKGDNVIILTGKDKGKKGRVITVDYESDRVTVEGLNLLVKHVRPKRQGEKGQRVQFARPLNVSNVALICPKCSKQIRVAYKILDDGKKMRCCKECKNTF